MENLELILKNMFEEHPLASADSSRPKVYEKMGKNSNGERVDISRQGCQSSVLDSIRSKVRLEMRVVVWCVFYGSTSGVTGFFV